MLGAQEACILDDGTVVITRGGLNDAWEPLDLTSHLVWLDGEDLSWEGELMPSEGPSMPSQEVTVVWHRLRGGQQRMELHARSRTHGSVGSNGGYV